MYQRHPERAQQGDVLNPAVGDLAAVRGNAAQLALNARTCIFCTVVHDDMDAATRCEEGACDRHPCGS